MTTPAQERNADSATTGRPLTPLVSMAGQSMANVVLVVAGDVLGVFAILFGISAIFLPGTLVTGSIALVLGLLGITAALMKRATSSIVCNVIGLVAALIGFSTSPLVWTMLGVEAIADLTPPAHSSTKTTPRLSPPQQPLSSSPGAVLPSMPATDGTVPLPSANPPSEPPDQSPTKAPPPLPPPVTITSRPNISPPAREQPEPDASGLPSTSEPLSAPSKDRPGTLSVVPPRKPEVQARKAPPKPGTCRIGKANIFGEVKRVLICMEKNGRWRIQGEVKE